MQPFYIKESEQPAVDLVRAIADSLILCRTPLQARLARAVLDSERIESYALLYLTRHDSPRDRNYFRVLAKSSSRSDYLILQPSKPDLLNKYRSMRQIPSWASEGFDNVLLGSINSFPFRAILKRNYGARLITFDDGTANINKGSLYFNALKYKKSLLYEKFFGIPSLDSVKKRIAVHYTIFDDFKNIVEEKRLRYLPLFDSDAACIEGEENEITFFIGQPFEEYLPESGIQRLITKIREVQIDYYVKHPRESECLFPTSAKFQGRELLAEDAILKHATGRRIRLVSGFSTVLFNIPSSRAKKTMYLDSHDPELTEKRRLAMKAGCAVVLF